MKNILLLTTTVMMVLLFSSCYYDKEELLYPNGSTCDTLTTITYTKSVVPILQQFCYSCHSGNSPSGGIAMGTYATDKAIGANGKLYGSINHSSGYSPMPQGMPKLTACQIAQIKKWIEAGMPNN
ncbi:hypothetical protein [Flavihumibacter fluvii]|uniref:hypothetical protein n=1 Tax=Flavihumibacter fluvii TaxID=2838157 RepID=UPI001BDE776B|nr:hypothetical protein [Flavihumibacter fluvii]ULQ51289.1 hypothetical protein KJS93_14455 [Flavihumibacter fluvii]